jgi:HD-GYP domain-containing protein (c-di-GMP phosphodiesterase class II)
VRFIRYVTIAELDEEMIVAQDVFDQSGRVLIAAGKSLNREIINSLPRYSVARVAVQENVVPLITSDEIYQPVSLVGAEIRGKLLECVGAAFADGNAFPEVFSQLERQVWQIIQELSKRSNVLIHLEQMDWMGDYLFVHSAHVGLFSIAIGMAMGLSRQELYLLGMGGLLHDLGKVRIDAEILNKETALSFREFKAVKEHALLGYNLLRTDESMDHRIMLMALQHHERCNGSGYPWGILGAQIHPLAKIVAVADVYDALTTDRVYRTKMTSSEAIQIIQAGAGIQFDEKVLQAFQKVAIPYSIGENVRLDNGLWGKVVRLNTSNLKRPWIQTQQGELNLLRETKLNIVGVAS